METVNEDDVCLSCGKSYRWHLDNSPRHPFNFGQDGSTDFLKPRRNRTTQPGRKGPQKPDEGPQIAGMLHDPVVRIALINKGILTPADLVAAEYSLREALSQVQGEPWSAQKAESSDSSIPTDSESTKHSVEKENPNL